MNTGKEVAELVRYTNSVPLYKTILKKRNETTNAGEFILLDNMLDVIERDSMPLTPMLDILVTNVTEQKREKRREEKSYKTNEEVLPLLIKKYGVSRLEHIFSLYSIIKLCD